MDPNPTDHEILLARHGETEWNRAGRWQGATDIPLSDTGREQARLLAARLAGRRIGRVYASHLARARETAEIVVATLGLTLAVSVDPRLRERGYGCFEGLTREQCAELHPGAWERYLADRRVVPPGAEPQTEVVERFAAAMAEVGTDRLEGATTLVVSHGGSIRSFVHAAAGVVLPPLDNVSIVRLGFQDGRWLVRADG